MTSSWIRYDGPPDVTTILSFQGLGKETDRAHCRPE